MRISIKTCVAIFVCILIAGCGKQTVSDQDAVRASVDNHLNGRKDLNLQTMIREVKQISVNGDHATALVEFRLNGSDARMDVEYTLQRQGKDWSVVSSQAKGMGNVPPADGQAPVGNSESGDKSGPPGHPPAN